MKSQTVKSLSGIFSLLKISRLAVSNKFEFVRTYSKQKEGVNLYTNRSHTCGQLCSSDVGKHVNLCGWLEYRRMDKFGILRDAYGSTQIIIPEERKDLISKLCETPLESVVSVEGVVSQRPGAQVNKKMATGSIEVIASGYEVLNPLQRSLPFNIRDYNKSKESLRMKYRYLDLRYPGMQKNLRLRSELLFKMREFLIRRREFVEVETPVLFKRTPGGAQEFLVTTRHPGEFYSLAQSPQQLKQLLMVGGVDRYFQVAKCFRDETSRPDRQPEFTQLDIELSFTSCDGVMALVEDLLAYSWPSGDLSTPFPRIGYREAIELYGTDKPDFRFDSKIQKLDDLLPPEESSKREVFPSQWKDVTARALKLPAGGAAFRKSFKKSVEELKKSFFPETWLSAFRVPEGGVARWEELIEKARLPLHPKHLWISLSLAPGDLLFLSIGEYDKVMAMLGRLRRMYYEETVGRKGWEGGHSLAWVVDFPLFLPGADGSSLVPAHHPFTRPNPLDAHLLQTQPLKVRGLHYDLLMDGSEVGGGSERVFDPVLQEEILSDHLGIPTQTLEHLIHALASGAPPHAGIALGLDRLLSLLVGAGSIRDVMAFPKGSEGRDPMSGAPSAPSKEELRLYSLDGGALRGAATA